MRSGLERNACAFKPSSTSPAHNILVNQAYIFQSLIITIVHHHVSGKFITALVLVFIAINVVDAKHKAPTSPKTKDPKGMRSQCSQWRAKGPPSTAKPPVMAKLMSAATQKPDAQTGGLQRRNTPPHQTGIEIGGGPSSVCNPNGGYNSTTTLGTCL
ncbi:hypothetical protein H4Q26_018211 [Puccinia striiformis f. sp. tritici PST-130]|nr:hypothetical protein H4Q26_018211 [Puccinia striiformis f. sp. tritici PST-130]